MDDQPAPPASRTKLYQGAPVDANAHLDANSSFAKVLELIAPGAVVLDVGCGAGDLDRLLAERGHEVWALDANAEALALAAPYCAGVRLADLETTDLAEVYGDARFDAIVFADSLEHLREPWRALQAARGLLRDGGTVIASIPNFAHAAVRLAVVSGSLPYRKSGILDDTHLRFFTRAGVESLFAECGFAVQAIERTRLPFGEPSNLVPDVAQLRVPAEIERIVREDPESETLQFVVRAIVVPGPWDMDALRGLVHDLQAQIEESAVGIGNLERSAAAVRERLVATEAERDALRAAVDEAERARDRHAEAADAAAQTAALASARVVEADERAAAASAAAAAREAAAAEREAVAAEREAAAAAREAEAAVVEAVAAAGETAARDALAAAEARAAALAETLAQREAESAELRAAAAAAAHERDEAAGAAAHARDEAAAGAERARALAGEWAARAAAAANRTATEAARADAAEAREREAAARASEAAARAAATTARLGEATSELRNANARARTAENALEDARQQLTEVVAERDRLLRREAERESVQSVLEDYERIANAAAGDGNQLWSAGPAG